MFRPERVAIFRESSATYAAYVSAYLLELVILHVYIVHIFRILELEFNNI
jgi:hypothetical protein